MRGSQAPIAIVGLAGAFASSRNVEEYWGNILNEVDCITDVPPSHWSIDDYYDPDPKAVDKSYSKRGGFLPDIDFNPLEFGLPPNILEMTDVSQLLSLVIAKQALSDAGYGPVNPHAEATGVVLGVSSLKQITPLVCRLQYPIWRRVLRSAGVVEADVEAIVEKIKNAYISWREDAFPGYLSNVVCGRIANRLDLRGINCSIDAACASSMASVQLAIHELTSHNCDMMIAGGVDTNNSIMAYLSFSKTPAFTAQDSMSPFDAASDGMLIGEGIGMLVLKRLDDAERDNDRIYAVIKGIGASSDGKFDSIYAPRIEGQELALRRAYVNADCPPSSIGLLEAHGTGTAAGDLAELAALKRVFGQGPAAIALGSVKSQIGHTKVAAGAASLIKAALALHHKTLPPTINISRPNPKLGIEESPFYLNTTSRPWFSETPRRAGVSSFGFGGTNFHAVLEEYASPGFEPASRHATPFCILLQAADAASLADRCELLADQLGAADGERLFGELICASKTIDIPPDAARIGFVAETRPEAASQLSRAGAVLRGDVDAEAFSLPSGVYFRRSALASKGGVVALFPGQGSQYLEMGKSLCLNFPVVRQAYASMDAERVRQSVGPITDVVFPPPVFDEERKKEQSLLLQGTQNAQPAIGAFGIGLYKLLHQAGLRPNFFAGHSLGELTALCAAGAIAEKDYLALLQVRGAAMAAPPAPGFDPGAMLAVSGDVASIELLIAEHPDVTVANRNSRSQIVLAGSRASMESLKSELAGLGASVTMLPVSAAFHSSRVAHAQEPFTKALNEIAFFSVTAPVYSNETAKPYPAGAAGVRARFCHHIVSPVNFLDEIENIYADGGRIFVEFGPGNTLTNLCANILKDRSHIAISLNRKSANDSDYQLRDAYVQLRVAGLNLTDIDPLQLLPAAGEHKPAMTVKLNGAAYVSEKTRAAFERGLSSTGSQTPQNPPSPTLPLSETPMQPSREEQVLNHPANTDAFEQKVTLTGNTSAAAHLRHLENMADHSAKYFDLLKMLHGLVINPNIKEGAQESFERGLNSFHQQQMLSQQVHLSFLQNQVEYSQSGSRRQMGDIPAALFDDAIPSAPRIASKPAQAPQPVDALPMVDVFTGAMPPAPESFARPENVSPTFASPTPEPAQYAAPPVAPPATQPIQGDVSSVDAAAAILLAVISEKTGYPPDTLDVSMDLVADLGIDSLKRVEIMAALEGKLITNLANLDFEKFAELRTIQQVASYLAGAEKKNVIP